MARKTCGECRCCGATEDFRMMCGDVVRYCVRNAGELPRVIFGNNAVCKKFEKRVGAILMIDPDKPYSEK